MIRSYFVYDGHSVLPQKCGLSISVVAILNLPVIKVYHIAECNLLSCDIWRNNCQMFDILLSFTFICIQLIQNLVTVRVRIFNLTF